MTIRRALVLTLGEFTDTQLPVAQRQPLIENLLAVYENEPDRVCTVRPSGFCGSGAKLQNCKRRLRNSAAKNNQLQARKPADKRQWYVNPQGQTFAIVDAGEFLMGSPESEPGRQSDKRPSIVVKLAGGLLFQATHVTKAQFGRFQTAHPEIPKNGYGPMGHDERFAADRHDLV